MTGFNPILRKVAHLYDIVDVLQSDLTKILFC